MPLLLGTLGLGALLLYLGAEWLVKGAAGLARELGVRPLLVGLTIVAYGTSLPEFVVSSLAAWAGKGDIAVGNVIGSNIANLGLVLGLTALAAPLAVDGLLLTGELPVLLLTAMALPLVFVDARVSRIEGVVLVLGTIVFTVFTARRGPPDPRPDAALVEAGSEAARGPWGSGKLRLSGIAAAGLVLLIAGGRFFVDGASALAIQMGMSERVVGLTIVAVGTSMPEFAASLVAALRGHPSLALGNLVGSNIFNILFVLGGAGLARPIVADNRYLAVDSVILLGFTCLAAVVIKSGPIIGRGKGALLALGYAAFLGFLVVFR